MVAIKVLFFAFLTAAAFIFRHGFAQHSHQHHVHHRHAQETNEPISIDEQIQYCNVSHMTEKDADYMDEVYTEYRMSTNNRRKLAKMSIPVYFHIVQNSRGQGGVSDANIALQMERLNDAFGPEFSFRLLLAQRVTNDAWFRNGLQVGSSDNLEMRERLRIGGSGSLNVYLCDTPSSSGGGTLLGVATFPTQYTEAPDLDGIVIYYQTVPGGRFGQRFSGGATLIHEVGHWLGLFHTFEDFGTGNGCNRGDRVDDTPPQRIPGSEAVPGRSCPTGNFQPDTCPGSGFDPIANFMDYTDDTCKDYSDGGDGFTPEQFSRMTAFWDRFREGDEKVASTGPVEMAEITGFVSEIEVTVEFVYDRFPEETEWSISDSSGTPLIRYPRGAAFGRLAGTVSLPPGTYTLQITDASGDGNCCRFGSGQYRISLANGETLISGSGEFGDELTREFTIEGRSTPGSLAFFRNRLFWWVALGLLAVVS